MRVEFTVPGEPVGKGRPRFNRYSGRAFTPDKTVSYENLVKIEYQMQCKNDPFPDKTMLRLYIKAYFGIPQSASKKVREAMLSGKQQPVKKPDLDNIYKIVADSLNQIAYHDDSQIVDGKIEKLYSENPRIEVMIENIETDSEDRR